MIAADFVLDNISQRRHNHSLFLLPPLKISNKFILRDKMDLQMTPKKCKFVQVLSHTDGNVQCDKKDFV